MQISLKVAGITENDDNSSTITFIAPVNAIRYNNAFPIFMDVDDFFNIDVIKLKKFLDNKLISKRIYLQQKTNRVIKAILPVHVWGNAANLEPLPIFLIN